ncbi:hypothetical protein CAPTEDRAFT_106261, partial [Capitella teleta]
TITEDQVCSKLLSIDPFKPAGPDNIHHIVLKEAASEITPLLTNFFNKSIQAGTIPSQGKLAHINPNTKKATRKANYHPISITCDACKVLEKNNKIHPH